MKRSTNLNTDAQPGNSSSDGSPEDNNFTHNNCSKMCSVPVGGARAKVKQHFCNIGNESIKVNNNITIQNGSIAESLKFCSLQNGASSSASSSSSSSSVNKTADKESNDVDCYMQNNVDCHNVVDKCPSKVKSQAMHDSESIQEDKRQEYFGNQRWSFADDESSSGNEGDEGLSGDDCCIYTYKGDQFADLPSSFFTLDMMANGLDQAPEAELARDLPLDENERSHAGSSPEMDFLEMDFDPGPSLEQDSEEEYDCFDVKAKTDNNISPVPELPSEQVIENDLSGDHNQNRDSELINVSVRLENDLGIANNVRNQISPEPQPGPSNSSASLCSPNKQTLFVHSKSTDSNIIININSNSAPRTCWPARDSWGHHCSSGDLCSPGDASEIEPGESLALWNAGNMRIQGEVSPDTRKYNLHSALYHCIMAKRLVMDKKGSLTEANNSCVAVVKGVGRDTKPPLDRTMIWSEQEACTKQVTQISTSACGATAVINVMLALNKPFSLERVKEGVATRLRAESAPIPQYLISRSFAGVTHEDLIRGIHNASDGTLYARFFHMYPERDFSLLRWLSYWMKKGAVPIATLNLQHGVAPENPIPDAWHHQMIFGVSSRGIYLTNPLECVHEGALWSQLSSPSILKIKRSDVISRWHPGTNLRTLMCQTDERWKKMNVLGQVVNMIRESTNTSIQGRVITQHISIPASYSSGITLVIPRDSPGYEELVSTWELPLYSPHPD